MAGSPREDQSGPVPPAFPPRDPARSPDTPGSGVFDDPRAGQERTEAGLRVELDLLRQTVGRLTAELSGLQQAMASRPVIDQARPDLALRCPEHPRPEGLHGLVVLPVGRHTARPAAWSLLFEHAVPTDRSSRAMLDRAARLATAARGRTG